MDYRFTLSVLGRLTLGYGLCILIPGLVSFLGGETAWRPVFVRLNHNIRGWIWHLFVMRTTIWEFAKVLPS